MKNFKLFLLSLSFGALALTGCKDECDEVLCQNGGTCNDGICACATGYEGAECATETRSKFLGSYSVSESCSSGNYTFNLTITTSSTGVRNVIINNFYDFGISVSATISGNSLTIPNQTVSSGGAAYTISGSGQITGNILTLTYTIAAGAESDSCTSICTKQ
ncbi:MAG: hypothetical protein GC193_03515 [Cryomorphaceae bacterium]|nr:hypothetical protein [Cryomorphaceae bacterium]